MNTYNTDLEKQTCTCLDWKESRQEFKINDPRRLCKHIINQLDINNLPYELSYFKESLEYYQKNEYAFTTDFEELIYISQADCKILYKNFGWINIYDKDGNKYGFLIYGFDESFKWAKNKKPQLFQEIEIFFDNDEYLPSIDWFDDEKEYILNQLDGIYQQVKINNDDMLADVAKEKNYQFYCDDKIVSVTITNDSISIDFTNISFLRDKAKVEVALLKRQEERKKINWYLENYKNKKLNGDKSMNYDEIFQENENKKEYIFENEWENKLKQYYGSAVVDKGLMLKFESFKLPRFVSEYIVSNFIEQYGEKEGVLKVEEFLSTYYPKPNSTDMLHYKIQQENEINIIDNFKVSVHIERHGNDHTLTIPALNIKNGMVDDHEIIMNNPRLLNSGLWGMGKITRLDNQNRVVLVKFKPFQVSSINLNLYKEYRKNFSSLEWLDSLLSTVGFNPNIFSTIREKLIILSRLLPLIQKSVFLFEFGKPGTGKTYIFDKLSNSSFVISGSKITPAKLFKDCTSKQEGLLRQYEAILFDEIDKINNSDFDDEIVNKLLKFMESNSFDRCGEEMMSNTSLIFSGNISKITRVNNIPDFFNPLAQKLKGEAFLDRFNGVIPGWEIKPLSNINGNFSTTQGFSADYFSAILSELRLEDIEAKIESMLEFSENTTNRDGKAIIKSVTGFFKLVFPDMNIDNYIAQQIINYCVELRQYIINERYALYGNEEDLRQLEVRLVV